MIPLGSFADDIEESRTTDVGGFSTGLVGHVRERKDFIERRTPNRPRHQDFVETSAQAAE